MIEKDCLVDQNDKAVQSISIIRDLFKEPEFIEEHRTAPKFFTRQRKLGFVNVILLILQKGVKSLQLILNEFFKDLGKGLGNDVFVTNSAFTQARRHLRYQAFITLNQKAIIDVLYGNKKYHGFKAFRVLSIDGSKIHLPNSHEICNEFGVIRYTNGKDFTIKGEHGYALASVMYDVLNKVILDAVIANAKAYEVDARFGSFATDAPW